MGGVSGWGQWAGSVTGASVLLISAEYYHSILLQEEMVKTFGETTVPEALKFFEQQASSNGAPEGWLFGTKVSPSLVPRPSDTHPPTSR